MLAGASVSLAAISGGCTRRVRSIVTRSSPDRVSLSIACMPADADPIPAQIARHLRTHLEDVGISTSIDYLSQEAFRLEVLVNHAFDIAIGRHPGAEDPDFLYGMLHSSFGPEPGWQNPSGFTNLDLDELLSQQRFETGEARRDTVARALTIAAREQAVAPIAFPIDFRAVRPDRYDGFGSRTFDEAIDILSLSPRTERDELRFTIGFTSPTKNLNPLSVERRTRDTITGLVYDTLVVRSDGETYPWLAESVDWNDRSAIATLRSVNWHDGEPVTAKDVVFTYRLLQDTSLGEMESPRPVPRFRSRSELIDEVRERDDRTVEFQFDAVREVAQRALTVPILPRHEWIALARRAELVGLGDDQEAMEAVVTDNIPPVGCGPYRFVDRSERNSVDLEVFGDHFSTKGDVDLPFRPPASRITVVVAPSDEGAVSEVLDGTIDFTLSPISIDAAEFEPQDPAIAIESPTNDFYHVTYNTRNEPLSNTPFRRLLSRLVDKQWIVDEAFGGHARPTATPITDERWIPDELQWNRQDPEVPFLGSDGHLDVEVAREKFVDIGFRYDEDGNLVGIGAE